ncbi:hypothetical protein [Pyxidicoccus caerfyrddinensis]|uniref:hypothetical protein n=1 Tax=Pyxidicoccus caerfyrddinensis TaxID=2709663 RepID=UPI0013D964DE|nr:hypothetical protein [Pyxidicoccus caerfyrddinensis]
MPPRPRSARLRFFLLTLLAASAVVGCGPTDGEVDEEEQRPAVARDGGTSTVDGGSPGDAGTRADAGTGPGDASTCTPNCAGRQCGADGCGGTCGSCSGGSVCTSTGQCMATCTPSCTGKTCGDDGCGGSCGTCGSGQACQSGRCVCVPRCDGRQCGLDGCGGTCGTCRSGTTCNAAGACVCVPQCQGKVCGPDSCGGTCGTCPSNSTCTAKADTCGCNPGYVPDQAGETCIKIGGACQGVSQYGYCASDTWVRCDAQQGIVAMACGAGKCRTIDSAGNGACTCGSIDANGVCASADGASVPTPKVHFACAESLGILLANNCVASTGSSAGLCSTFVTSFGHQTGCFCNTCSLPAGSNNQCSPLCARPSDCRYYAASNTHTCGF